MKGSRPEATVIVCTRNRSSDLRKACEAILAVRFDPRRWNMLIVDNASTDDTLEVARHVADQHEGRVRVVAEKAIGLSAARNAGIAVATGKIVVFIDDDAFPEPEWLTALVEAFRREDVMCAGGPVTPLFQGQLPSWFRGRYLPYLSAWDRGEHPLELRYNEYPRGTNIAFRRDVFDRVGTFNLQLGRKANSLLSCEEIELCLRIERAGFTTLYVPRARVEHLTKVDRITPKWLLRRFAAQGHSEAILNWIHGRWTGLRIGLRLCHRNWMAAREECSGSNELLVKCQWWAMQGYLAEIPRAVLATPRYRPADPTVQVAPWQPVG